MAFNLILVNLPTAFRFQIQGIRSRVVLVFFLLAAACLIEETQAADGLTIGWTNNMLTIKAPGLPGERVDILYLEAFCRSGSTHRDWHETTIPHKTELVESDPQGKPLRLRTRVEPGDEVVHDLRAGRDEGDFPLEL